jgi:cysteine desulfurase
MPRTIYFDYNATTPLDPAVRDAMLPFLGEVWGNPSSVITSAERRGRCWTTRATGRPSFSGAKPSEIIFTSGGTESTISPFSARRGAQAKGKHLITSAVEHHAVLQCFDYLEKKEGFEVTRLPVDSGGRVSPDDLKKAIRRTRFWFPSWRRTMKSARFSRWPNSARFAASAALFSHGRVQWFGKEPFENIGQFNADLVSFAPTNFTGRKARACFTSNRRCIPTRFCLAADMKMNAAPARKIWRESSVLFRPWKNL